MDTDERTPMTTTPSAEVDPTVVTDERAAMLAAHAIHVQGGYSDPMIERARAEADIAAGNVPDWDKMQAEVNAALMAKVTAPATPAAHVAAEAEVDPAEPEVAPQRVDVTAVLANIDQGEALRDRIKAMTAELKIHEDAVKDVLGAATVGTDATGKVVVRYPFRNRSGLNKERVKDRLSAEDYAECITETSYRTLLYGES